MVKALSGFKANVVSKFAPKRSPKKPGAAGIDVKDKVSLGKNNGRKPEVMEKGRLAKFFAKSKVKGFMKKAAVVGGGALGAISGVGLATQGGLFSAGVMTVAGGTIGGIGGLIVGDKIGKALNMSENGRTKAAITGHVIGMATGAAAAGIATFASAPVSIAVGAATLATLGVMAVRGHQRGPAHF